MKGMHQLLTQMPTSTALDASSEDQKAFGILIDTLKPSQYRYIDGHTRVRIAYDALVAQHKPTTKVDQIQVAMEWAKLSWDPYVRAAETESNQVVKLLALMLWEFRHLVDRLPNLPDSEQTVAKTKIALEAERKAAVGNGAIKTPRGQANEVRALFGRDNQGNGGRGRSRGRGASRSGQAEQNDRSAAKGTCDYCGKEGHWQSEFRKKARENGRPNLKGHWPDGKDDHSNVAVFMFSATESGIDMIALSQEVSNNETKDNEEPDEEPTQDASVVNGPIYMGEPGEALPLRTDPDWHPTVQPPITNMGYLHEPDRP
ncbi:hypothetical protein H310_13738 [Aphanomyces invadans]|uniref:CCHC-type domain-containing protein n=1 Tax=Aphanomyces invadans TaxID=157072 RepID=A0A024TBX1_9STRA|nr:hypothetical protein H310_13738 [Aphanomyces invadans]ETV91660.1 hypothetical protein H310_13738 [Aphanomyces invadans]|eukprot:XP_008879586.1 hypothetical protein H310_13738 [Aphanomyces invadans]